MLRVDSESLRALSSALTRNADDIGALDPCAAIDSAAQAMPNSAFGKVAEHAAEPVATAYRAMADRVRTMADAAIVSAQDYDQAESAFAAQLAQYLRM